MSEQQKMAEISRECRPGPSDVGRPGAMDASADHYIIAAGQAYYPSEEPGDWKKVMVGVGIAQAMVAFGEWAVKAESKDSSIDWAKLIYIGPREKSGYMICAVAGDV